MLEPFSMIMMAGEAGQQGRWAKIKRRLFQPNQATKLTERCSCQAGNNVASFDSRDVGANKSEEVGNRYAGFRFAVGDLDTERLFDGNNDVDAIVSVDVEGFNHVRDPHDGNSNPHVEYTTASVR